MFKKIFTVIATTTLMAGSVDAASTVWTEGARSKVVGSTSFNAGVYRTPNGEMGYLGNVTQDDSIDLHGRLDKNDWDDYRFSADTDFRIDLIFGGIEVKGEPSKLSQSGIVDRSGETDTGVVFTLTRLGEDSFSETNTLMSDIVSADDDQYNGSVFTGVSGDYLLQLRRYEDRALNDVQFDLRFEAASDSFNPFGRDNDDDVSPVPLPAGGVLMISALAGLAGIRRFKKAS